MFQYPEYQLFEETVYQDISFGPKNMGLDEAEVDRRVREAARFVGLRDEQLEKSPLSCPAARSAGWPSPASSPWSPRCSSWTSPPPAWTRWEWESILGNIRDYHQAHNATIILVSHSMEEVARTVDRLVVVNDGRIPFHGAPSEVFQHGPELEAMGLGVPQMTRVFNRLRAMGVDIGPSVYTIEQAKAAVLAKLKGVG